MNASNKAEYLAYNKPYTNAVIGSPYLYVIAGTFRPNAGEWVEPFTAAANANRLTFYVKPPAGATALGGDHPYPAWSIGPYSNTQTSGHYYHSFIGMNGWEKLQLTAGLTGPTQGTPLNATCLITSPISRGSTSPTMIACS
jgi:hypothetical protein